MTVKKWNYNTNLQSYYARKDFEDFYKGIKDTIGGSLKEKGFQFEAKPFEEEGFVRLGIKPFGEKRKPLTIDISPGYQISEGWGSAIELRSPSGWSRMIGAEIWYEGKEEGPQFRTPTQALERYIEGSFNENLVGMYGSYRDVWNTLITRGHRRTQVPGGLMSAGPVHPEAAWQEFASRVTVGLGAGVDPNEAMAAIQEKVQYAGEPIRDPYAELAPYAPIKGDDRIIRMRQYGRAEATGEPGGYDWQVFGLGKSAADVLKRLNILPRGGLRERAQLFEATPDRKGVVQMQPKEITGMDWEQRAGYRWPTFREPGATQREGVLVRPGVYGAPTSTPGTLGIYRPLEGIFSGGYPGKEPFKMRIPHMKHLQKAEFEFGIMEEVYEGKGEERKVVDYKRTRELEGAVLQGGESAIVGWYRVPSATGEPPAEKVPMRVTAGTRMLMFGPESETVLDMPAAISSSSGEAVSGLTMDKSYVKKPPIEEPGLFELAKAPSRRVEDPVQLVRDRPKGYRRSPYDIIEERFPGEVTTLAREGATIHIPVATQTGVSEKNVIKAMGFRPAGVEQLIGDVESGVPGQLVSAMTGELKGATLGFFHAMKGIPRERVSEAFGLLGGRTGRMMSEYVTRVGMYGEFQPSEQGGIEPERMARFYAHVEGSEYKPGETIWRMFEKTRQAVEALPLEQKLERFGYGTFKAKDAPWLPIGFMTPDERTLLRKQAYEGMKLGPKGTGEGGLVGDKATERLNEFLRFRRVYKDAQGEAVITGRKPEGGEFAGYMAESKLPGTFFTSASAPTPEHLSKVPMLGFEENAAITMAFPEEAKRLGLHTAQRGTPTGFEPPHATAWREVGDIYRHQITKGEEPYVPKTVTEITPEIREKIEQAYMTGEDVPFEELEKIVGGKGPLYNPASGEMLERPSTMAAITAYRFRDQEYQTPINFMASQYPKAVQALISGQSRSAGSLGKMFARRQQVFQSASGTAVKLLQSRFAPSALGGRYAATTGVGLNAAVMSKERMGQMFRQIAGAQGITPSQFEGEGLMSRWQQQVFKEGGLPGVAVRYPVQSREHAAIAANFLTPEIVKARTGIDIPDASSFEGGRAKTGAMTSTGILAAFGPQIGRAFGDWDADMMAMVGAVKIDPETHDLMFPKKGSAMYKALRTSGPEAMGLLDKAMRDQMGEVAGVAAGSLNVQADALREMAFGKEAGVSFDTYKPEEVYIQAMNRLQSRGGMGVAYNLRRGIESASGALGLPREDIAKTHTSQSFGYQQYLDYLTNIQAQGGYSHLETLAQSGIFTQAQGSKGAAFMAKFSPTGKFVNIWESLSDRDTYGRFSRRFGKGLAAAVGRDVKAENMLPEAAAAMFQTPGMDLQKLIARVTGHKGGVTAALGEMIDEPGYDILKSPIGLFTYGMAMNRTEGEFLGKAPRYVDTEQGGRRKVLDLVGQETVPFQGGYIRAGEVREQQPYRSMMAAYQQHVRKGGLLDVETSAFFAGTLEQMEKLGTPPADMEYYSNQMRMYEDVATVQKSGHQRASRLTEEEVSSILPSTPRISGSVLPHFALPAGRRFGASPEMEEKWAGAAREKLVGANVLGLGRETLNKIYPIQGKFASSAEAKRFGTAWEEQLTGKLVHAGWTDVKRDLKSTWMPTEAGKNIQVSGTPDIMGITPRGTLGIVEAKATGGKTMEEALGGARRKSTLGFADRVQAALYGRGFELGEKQGKSTFYDMARNVLGERKGWEGTAERWYQAASGPGIEVMRGHGAGVVTGGQWQGGEFEEYIPKTGRAFDFRDEGLYPVSAGIVAAEKFQTSVPDVTASMQGLYSTAAQATPAVSLPGLAGQISSEEPARHVPATGTTVNQQQVSSAASEIARRTGVSEKLLKGMGPYLTMVPGMGIGSGNQPPEGGIPMMFLDLGGEEGGGGKEAAMQAELRSMIDVNVRHFGQGTLPEDLLRQAQTGIGAARMMENEPYAGFWKKARGFVAETAGVDKDLVTRETFGKYFGQALVSEGGMGKFGEFSKMNRTMMTQAGRQFPLVAAGLKAARSTAMPIDAVSQEERLMLEATMEGLPGTGGQSMMAASVMGAEASRKGLMKAGALPTATEAEQKTIDSAVLKLNATIEKTNKLMKEGNIGRDALTERFKEEKRQEIDISKAELAPGLRETRDIMGRWDTAKAAGLDPIATEGILQEDYDAAVRKSGPLEKRARALEMQRQVLDKPPPGGGAQATSFMRKMIGGWGLFYMGHLAQLGMGPLKKGYEESLQFMQQTQQAGVQAVGAGQLPPYETPEQEYQEALLRSGGTVFSRIREASAGLTGGPLDDLSAAGMTGLAASGLSLYTASAATAIKSSKWLQFGGGALAKAAGPIGLVATGATLLASQAAYMKNKEDTLMQAAAAGARGDQWTGLSKGAGIMVSDIFQGKWRPFGEYDITGPKETDWPDSYAQQKGVLEQQILGFAEGQVPVGREGPFGPKEMLRFARTVGMYGELPGTEGLEPAMVTQLSLRAQQAGQGGEDVGAIGQALASGIDVDAMSAAIGTFAGRGVRPVYADYTRQAELAKDMPIDRYTKIQAGLNLMQKLPGIRSYLASGKGASVGGRGAMAEKLLGVTGDWDDLPEEVRDQFVQDMAEKEFGEIAEGPYEGKLMERWELQYQRTALGLETDIDREKYIEGEWTPEETAAWREKQTRQTRGAQAASTFAQMGLTQAQYGPIVSAMETSPEGLRMMEGFLNRDPVVLTEMAMKGMVPGDDFRGIPLNELMASADISSKTGLPTGRQWGTTNLQRGNVPAAEMGAKIFNMDVDTLSVKTIQVAPGISQTQPGAAATGTLSERSAYAAVQGLDTTFQGRYGAIDVPEYMQGKGGLVSLQWQQKELSFEYQQQMFGIQQEQLDLQAKYQPQFWAIEDKQMDLQYRQAMYGFGQQRQQLQMQSQQFYENMGLQRERGEWGFQYQQMQMGMQREQFQETMGLQWAQAQWGFEHQQMQFEMQGRQFGEQQELQRRGSMMQRGWQRRDWQYEDQMRGMQWGWKQEDFQEEVRFMSGRQRKLAERGMERETTVFNLEGDRINEQRDRQKELWQLEDERFDMVIRHNEEQRALIEKNMEMQKAFFEEGFELRVKQFEQQQELALLNLEKQQEFFEAGMEMQIQHHEQQIAMQMANIAAQQAFFQEGFALRQQAAALQRAYWEEQHALSQKSLEIQKQYAIDAKLLADKIAAMVEKQGEYQGTLSAAWSDVMNLTQTFFQEIAIAIQNAINQIGGYTFNAEEKAAGGHIVPGGSYIVGERGPELISPGVIGTVTPLTSPVAGLRDKWQDSMTMTSSFGGSGDGSRTIVINIGNRRLGSYVIDAFTNELEVV